MTRPIHTLTLVALTATLTTQATAAVIAVPPVQADALTHAFTPASAFPFPMPARSLDSFTIGDGNYSGGGAFGVSTIATGDVAKVRLQAPAGKRFATLVPNVSLSLSLQWQAGGDSASTSGGTVTFEDLGGVAPVNTYSFLSVGGNGNAIISTLQYTVATPITFTAIDIAIPVQTNPAAGPRNFNAVTSTSNPAFAAFATTATNTTVMAIQSVPEPAGLALLALGGVGLLRRGRR